MKAGSIPLEIQLFGYEHRAPVGLGGGIAISRPMRQYLDLMQKALDEGTPKADRTGTGTRSIFGHQMRFDLAAGFPIITTKRLHIRSIIYELLWFIRGD